MFTETKYANSGDLQIAYRTTAPGARDILFASNWFGNVEVLPELAPESWAGLAKLGRVIIYDQLGTGASDPISLDSPPTLEQWTDTLLAVLDAVGSPQAVVIANDSGFPTAAMFAATHPGRTAALVVLGAFSRVTRADDYPIGIPADVLERGIDAGAAVWGTAELQRFINPDSAWPEETRAVWARMERLAVTPNTFRRMTRLAYAMDVRDILSTIRVPTLVLHHANDTFLRPEAGRYIADHIPAARFVEIPGRNHYLFLPPGWRRVYEEISEFLTGTRATPQDDDRVLATVLFTDIIDSTRLASEMGDRDWRALLDAHDAVVRSQLTRFRGREVKTTGDGFLATFDGPQRAIRCAIALREALEPLGVEIRAGLHTGECEVRGEDVGGIAVHIGARVSALARPGEILASGTLRDLVVGSGLAFEDRGTHELKGVPGEWRLYVVTG